MFKRFSAEQNRHVPTLKSTRYVIVLLKVPHDIFHTQIRYTGTGSAALGPLQCLDSTYVSSVAAWTGSDASTVTYRRRAMVTLKPTLRTTGSWLLLGHCVLGAASTA